MSGNQHEHQTTTEKITATGRISGLLSRVRDNHTLLTVTLPNNNKIFNSIILDIDNEQSQFELDELSPKYGHELLLETGSLQIQTRLDGVDISFSCHLKAVDQQEGIAFYRMALPEVLLYRQQRADFRVPISAGRPGGIYLVCENGKEIEGYLRDLSISGVGLRFATTMAEELKQGEIISQCVLDMPNNKVIQCPIQIRYVNPQHNGKFCIVGAKFIDLSKKDEKAIVRLVTMLDREIRKKT